MWTSFWSWLKTVVANLFNQGKETESSSAPNVLKEDSGVKPQESTPVAEPAKQVPKVEPVVVAPELPKKYKLIIDDMPYGKLFQSLVVKPAWLSYVKATANKIYAGRETYKIVSRETGDVVPWFVVGLKHYRESNCNFKTHLHNGDSLSARTVNVPKGRPFKGSAPFEFLPSANDALMYNDDGVFKGKGSAVAKPWNDVGDMGMGMEEFNGIGYRLRDVPAPYLWSGSQHYVKGKSIRDHVYDKNAVDDQLGVMPILKYMYENGLLDA